MSNGRKIPYTENGIKRLQRVRCGKLAAYQWKICSDNSVYRPICTECDILLNCLVLTFMRDKNVKEKIAKYKEKLRGA